MIRVLEYNETNTEKAIDKMISFLNGRVYAKGTELEFELEPIRTKKGFTVEMPDGNNYGFSNLGKEISISVNGVSNPEDNFEPQYWSETANNMLQYIQDAAPGFSNNPRRNLWSK